jgi:hypothetical protein
LAELLVNRGLILSFKPEEDGFRLIVARKFHKDGENGED